jgi:hypothetical protein
MSVKSLYNLWIKTPNKAKLGLEAQPDSVEGIIEDWMYHNFNNLVEAYFSKMRLKTHDPKVLYKFLYSMNSESINYFEVFIPPKGFSLFY